MIPECIYSKRWGGEFWKRLFCCHVWTSRERYKHDRLMVVENQCVECGRYEIMLLIYWENKK